MSSHHCPYTHSAPECNLHAGSVWTVVKVSPSASFDAMLQFECFQPFLWYIWSHTNHGRLHCTPIPSGLLSQTVLIRTVQGWDYFISSAYLADRKTAAVTAHPVAFWCLGGGNRFFWIQFSARGGQEELLSQLIFWKICLFSIERLLELMYRFPKALYWYWRQSGGGLFCFSRATEFTEEFAFLLLLLLLTKVAEEQLMSYCEGCGLTVPCGYFSTGNDLERTMWSCLTFESQQIMFSIVVSAWGSRWKDTLTLPKSKYAWLTEQIAAWNYWIVPSCFEILPRHGFHLLVIPSF